MWLPQIEMYHEWKRQDRFRRLATTKKKMFPYYFLCQLHVDTIILGRRKDIIKLLYLCFFLKMCIIGNLKIYIYDLHCISDGKHWYGLLLQKNTCLEMQCSFRLHSWVIHSLTHMCGPLSPWVRVCSLEKIAKKATGNFFFNFSQKGNFLLQF